MRTQVGIYCNVSGFIFVSPHQSKAEYIFTKMNEEVLAASALLIQSGAFWSVFIYQVGIRFARDDIGCRRGTGVDSLWTLILLSWFIPVAQERREEGQD
jgi:hypothetical protein